MTLYSIDQKKTYDDTFSMKSNLKIRQARFLFVGIKYVSFLDLNIA